jgi:hypothetical protein
VQIPVQHDIVSTQVSVEYCFDIVSAQTPNETLYLPKPQQTPAPGETLTSHWVTLQPHIPQFPLGCETGTV